MIHAGRRGGTRGWCQKQCCSSKPRSRIPMLPASNCHRSHRSSRYNCCCQKEPDCPRTQKLFQFLTIDRPHDELSYLTSRHLTQNLPGSSRRGLLRQQQLLMFRRLRQNADRANLNYPPYLIRGDPIINCLSFAPSLCQVKRIQLR